MKLQVLQEEHWTCQSCSHCCRHWYVTLMPGEAEQVQALPWPKNDPLAKVEGILTHGKKQYLLHRDGGCVYLNKDNGYCRIHEQFGFDTKPLGCRVFPFQIAPTFKGEASVTPRYDCPTVRKNEGASHAEQMKDIRYYASRMELSETFDERTCRSLARDQIQGICDFIGTLMAAFQSDAERALFISFLCDWIEKTPPKNLDRVALAGRFSPLKEQIAAAMAEPVRSVGAAQRMTFRTLLGLYMRRDEDVLQHLAGRSSRMFGLTSIIFGFGSFRAVGLCHKPGKLRTAKLFKPVLEPHDPAAFGLFWRVVRNRLESFQFMGKGNNNRDLLSGLRSLALLYPLTAAVAKYNAANRSAARIEPEDVDYAVASIEHSYGRLPVLNQPFTRSLEKVLLEPGAFTRLVRNFE